MRVWAALLFLTACGSRQVGASNVSHLPPGTTRVCIFDFDDTIKMGDDSVAPGAKYVIDACASRGYRLALATAGCSSSYVRQYLRTRVDPDQWTPDILNSDAFQACQPVKRYSIPPILSHYGISSAPGCAVLFDQEFNRKFADQTGTSFQPVDERTGLRVSDWDAALAQLDQHCK
jgi:hypothetical protein